MKLRYIFVVVFAVALLSGCGSLSAPLSFSVPNVGISEKKIDAELRSTTVTIARPEEQTGNIDINYSITSIWQTGLTEALNRMVIFKDEATMKVNLSIKVLKFSVPYGGFTRTTDVAARYEIIDRNSGAIVLTQDISSSGTPPDGFAFPGVAVMVESINRAVQNNIAQFLQILETVDVKKPMFPAKVGGSN